MTKLLESEGQFGKALHLKLLFDTEILLLGIQKTELFESINNDMAHRLSTIFRAEN